MAETLDAEMPPALAAPLQITGLHLAYGSVPALRGVDLSVARGEFVALLGPSGCGKTSLLRAIAGFVQPQRGRIALNGSDVAGLPPRARNIGLVFQSYALFPHMTALDNVRFGLNCRGVPKSEAARRAQAALEMVGLADLAARRPRQLSGGQQQRVALARALVIEPDLLLLDEPLGALDKQLRVQMQTELRALQRRLGVTAVFVTHDQEEAMSMADRIVVMRDGVVAQVDTPETLFARPATAWVCEFVGGGNLLRGHVLPGLAAPPGQVVQLPFDKVRLCPAAKGFAVTGRRFLGATVEVQLAYPGGVVCAHLSPAEATPFPLGAHARVDADPAHCRLLPDR